MTANDILTYERKIEVKGNMKKEQKQSDLIAKKGMIEIQEMRNTCKREVE